MTRSSCGPRELISPSPSALVNRLRADQLSAREISRSPEVRCSDPAPGEARERSLVDSPPFLPALSISPSFLLRLHFRRFMIGLNVPVLAQCETDKSEYHQDGSGDHQPMRILHRGEHGLFPLRLQPSFLSGARKL